VKVPDNENRGAASVIAVSPAVRSFRGGEQQMHVHILIADDAPAVRGSIRALLEREKFEVVGEASDGAEAARLARSLEPDVVILDFYMPGLDGIETAGLIRACAPRARLVMLTVDAAEEYILAAFSAGFQGYVQKSDAPEDLARAVYEVFGGGKFLSVGPSRVVLDALLAKTTLSRPTV
jgi:DNA-binding NarL/FixJ family response regulator